METNRVREHGFFQVPTFANQIGYRVAVIDPGNVLMDDRAFVEIGGCIVCGGANQFYSAGVCLMVRLATGKCREKGVVYVDDRAVHLVQKIR